MVEQSSARQGTLSRPGVKEGDLQSQVRCLQGSAGGKPCRVRSQRALGPRFARPDDGQLICASQADVPRILIFVSAPHPSAARFDQEGSQVPKQGFSYRFREAVARKPGRSVVRGLRATDQGAPDFERFGHEHREYLRALERAGVTVTVLPALEEFPDSVFVEDAAFCLPNATVILRPGAPSRRGEAAAMAAALAPLGHEIIPCEADGFIDGGDILVTDSEILVGLSERTNRSGFEWFRSVLERLDYEAKAMRTPDGVLHFKSDCCVLDSNTILATHRLSGADCFRPYRVFTVPRGEEAAANAIRVNDTVLLPAGFPATAELLAGAGYAVETVPASQASLLDGGLSCMSLRIH